MYSKIANIILILFLTTASFYAQDKIKSDATTATTSGSGSDESAIRAVVKQMETGWNAKSGAEFAKPFAEDADYVIINGIKIKSREAIAKGHQSIFDTFYKNTTLSMAVEQIRFLRPDVAVAHVSGLLKLTEGDASHTTTARMTLLLTKTKNGSWEIAAFQNTEVKPLSPQK